MVSCIKVKKETLNAFVWTHRHSGLSYGLKNKFKFHMCKKSLEGKMIVLVEEYWPAEQI